VEFTAFKPDQVKMELKMKELMPYKDRKEKFTCCDPIGFLGWPLCSCCEKEKTFDAEGNEQVNNATDFQEELGLGISLYFKMTSFLGWMFALFTILSMPVYVLFAMVQSNDPINERNRNYLSNITLGLGSMGEAANSCITLPSITKIRAEGY